MIRRLLLLALLVTGFAYADGRVFELRVYTANEGKLEALKARFRDHTTAIFKKHHMEVIGYWTPEPSDPKSKDTFIYILAHPSREAAEKNWKEFQVDPEWTKVKTESEKEGALAKKVDSTFMDATNFSPMK
ncbi:MAG: NIPSNAP family protein [Bryobacterales bacterium]|nr:NIPSNAP family protein [Bryobacterales bacterium]MBV9398819.1 NIPSNAP family protein [Bryobacterales bacterium]